MLRRKYILLLGLLMFGIPKLTHAQVNFVTGSLTAQAAACPTSPGPSSSSTSALTISTVGYGGATFTLGSSAFSATVSFYGSGDGGTTWQPLNTVASNATSAVLTATATGLFQTNVAGYTNVCMVVTTFVSGTVTARIQLSTISARAGGGVSGGGLPAGCTSPASAQLQCSIFIATSAFQNVGAAAQELDLFTAGGCNGITCTGFKVGLLAPPTLISSVIWQLPGTDVTGGVLTSNGSGVLSLTNPTGVLGFNATNPAYGVLADGHINFAPSWTSGSNVVTCATCNFQGTDPLGRPIAKVGQIIFGTNTNPAGAGANSTGVVQLPQTTIQSIDSNTQIHTVGNANANWTIGPLVWGDDDTTTLAAAWTAAANACGILNLPAGIMLVQQGEFITSPANNCSSNVASTRQGPGVNGAGMAQTIIVPTPSFDPTTCIGPNAGGSACFFGDATGTFSGGMIASNLTIWAGNSSVGAGFSGKHAIEAQANSIFYNVAAVAWGGNTTSSFIGLNVSSFPSYIVNTEIDGVGQRQCAVSVPSSPYGVSFVNSACVDGGTNGLAPLDISSTSMVVSNNSIYLNGPNTSGAVQVEGIFYSTNDTIGGPQAATSYGLVGNGGTAYVTNANINLSGTNSNFGVFNAASGSKVYISNSKIAGGNTGGAIKTVAGSSFFDLGGNTFSGGSVFSGTAGTVNLYKGASGACTGTATSSSTLGLYGTGPNETVTTCTSATVGSGIVMDHAGTLQLLQVTASHAGVNASSGVVTVLKNGSGTTITCTIGTGTACVDGTHTVAFVVGDLISFNFTTQGTEVLAGVNASVEAY